MIRTTMLTGVALMALVPVHAVAAPAARAGAAPAPVAPPLAAAPIDAQEASREDIIITAPVQRREDEVLQGTSVLKGDALTRSLRPTIGETLAQLPGVSATSFGPNSSRPVLRGLQGERIRVLTDGIGSIDVSNTSVDHAVAINPLLADRIEVLRGPSALLFGSSALGGVVNVIDSRIPRAIPENGFRLSGIGTYGSAADERTGQLAGDVALGRLVLHADGSYTATSDLRIGGFALTPARRAEALASSLVPPDPADPEPINFAANAAIRNRLPNTASETWTAGFGASYIGDTGMIGISYGHYDSLYGVPVRYATQLGEGQEAPRIDIVQNRVDLRAEVETGGEILERIKFRAGHATYRHFELEPDGEIATRFFNNGLEGRLEIIQAKRGVWSGASGVQFFNRQFNVDGEEAFLPRSETNQTGLFTLQQLDFGRFKAEAGARYEFTDLSARTPDGDLRFFDGRRDFGAFSGSIGGSYGLTDNVRAGLNFSYTERAPSAEELFANGGHPATQAYELGNPTFRLERSVGIEATLHAHGDGYSFDLAAYYNDFSNFISENQVDQAVCEAAASPSGRDVDLPCFQFLQGDARYYGVEAKGSLTLGQIADFKINADLLGDYVRADLDNLGPAPRIPPARVLGGLEAQSDRINGRVEVEHVFVQNRLAGFETRTVDYTMVNASIAFSPFGRDSGTTLLVSANNLFDVDARRHASFLKDFAPLAGRDIRVTARFGF
ncbi:MAG: TonB-dependent receptor [Sphingomonas sp. 28-62-20]|uniref:TonB-dependent receptor n=1 Tax=Sphingomonas sp. 28-62-20 TaxID=1970433 RepID=UPI000BD7A344|nr:MAG: TonB-dependent receptor [Sphingomonas sp. 28-62-20]